MKKKVIVGSYKSISTDLFGSKMLNMDFNQICLLVGKNGTGKTLILILSWIVNYITFSWVQTKGNMPMTKYADFLFQKSYDRCDWTGYAEADYDNLILRIELDKGVVTNVLFTPKDPNVEFVSAAMPIFMSKETRLFTQIQQYLKLKKMLNLGSVATFNEQDLEKLTDMYKIYDIMFIERMVAGISNPTYKIPEVVVKNLHDLIENKKISHISYDEIGCNFIIYEDKPDGTISKYHATMLSAGEQALVNMCVNSSL